MNNTKRLRFHVSKSAQALTQLWQNCAGSPEKLAHLNAYSPSKLLDEGVLHRFLNHQERFTSWVIQNKADDNYIGYIVHGEFFPGLPNSLGYVIGLPYIKQGFASEALTALLAHLAANGHTATFAYCLENNQGSVKTLKKCGFENQGTVHKIGVESLQFKINLI